MHKKKIKLNIKNIIFNIVLLICVGLCFYSGYHIFIWGKENEEVSNVLETIEEVSNIIEKDDTEETEIVNPPEIVENDIQKDPYWDYIKLKLIDVDFKELKKINGDVVGWIQVLGTNINYPFVQTTDNSYYLTHQFDKSYNSAGWVFMDYRNNKQDFDKNTIIYAHGRLNNTMFGSLRNVIENSWYSNPDNSIVKISTETENSLWQVFSVYRIKPVSDYIQINFSSDEKYLSFLNMLEERSVYNFNVNLTQDDKIITLSTCYDDTYRVVLHAKLIKKEVK